MAARTIAAKPAAGPETEMLELEKNPITIPPITPAITPESGGAPEAKAIPKHKGSATRNTTIPEGRLSFIPPNIFFAFFIFFEVLMYAPSHNAFISDNDNPVDDK